MDFALNEEQQIIQAAAREFARNEIAPVAAGFDESGEFPAATVRAAGELGFMGVEVPEEYGGAGLDAVSYALIMTEISAADAAHGTILSVNNSLYGVPLLRFGTERQKRRFLAPVASGEVTGAYALTEPQSGSDARAMRSRAELSRDGTHYKINAKKSWITSGPVAKYLILFAQTYRANGDSTGISAFLIDADMDGYIRGKHEPKLGIRASATCEIELHDYRCPVENRIGEEGAGFRIAMTVLDSGRIGITALSVGLAQGAYEAAMRYAKERRQFGQPIAAFQAIQWKFADNATRIEAARLLTYRAAYLKDRGVRTTRESSMAKLFASEIAVKAADDCVQIHGGYGFVKDYPAEKYFRDVKLLTIGEGTSEIQRLVIARQLLSD